LRAALCFDSFPRGQFDSEDGDERGDCGSDDFDAAGLRVLAGSTKDASQARRLLAIAAVCKGMDRNTAARIVGMDPGSSPGPDAARLGAPLQRTAP
jgi:hypothetical protein